MKNEIIRKILHLAFLGMIPLIQITSVRIGQLVLILFSLVYYIFEQLRLHNKTIPILSKISNLSIRKNETHTTAFAPLTLALGIALVSELYYLEAMAVAVVAATIGDSSAALVGKCLPNPKLWWNHRKSFSGFFANWIAVSLTSLIWVSPIHSICVGFVSAGVESLNLEHVDNLMVPLAVGASLYLL